MDREPSPDMESEVSLEELRRYATQERAPFFQIAKDCYRPGMKVLDVGAGEGSFAHYLADPGIFLIEGNPANAALLKETFKNVVIQRVPETSLPFDPGTFDLIHCSHLVEHLDPQQLYELLLELDRCLAQKGFLVISAPLLWEGFYGDLSHVKPYSPYVFRNYLCSTSSGSHTRKVVASGYEVVRLQYRYRRVPMPYLTLSWSRSVAHAIMHRLSAALRRLAFGYYEKTGYTLVLRKGQTLI